MLLIVLIISRMFILVFWEIILNFLVELSKLINNVYFSINEVYFSFLILLVSVFWLFVFFDVFIIMFLMCCI